MRTVHCTRYVTPLREGGSLPAIVEADDNGMYVLKLRGSGQGPKALIADLLGGEIARALGLNVPEIVYMELDASLARLEPDPEIQQLLQDSAGLNLALDYLPGSITFDPVVEAVSAQMASTVVWLDALITNVDRTARNANMLTWHNQVWLIDHGAALYMHHRWDDFLAHAAARFPAIKDHVLLPHATAMEQAHQHGHSVLSVEKVAALVDLVPDAWLMHDAPFSTPQEHRQAYAGYLLGRLAVADQFAQEVADARALGV